MHDQNLNRSAPIVTVTYADGSTREFSASQLAGLLHKQAIALLETGQIETGREILELLAKGSPDDAEIWTSLGEVYCFCDQAEQALQCAHRAIELRPDQPKSWAVLGLALSRSGQAAPALAAFQKAVALDQEHPYALRALAAFLMEYKGSPTEAEHLLRQAIRLDPKSQPGWTLLGMALERQAEFKDADRAYLKAIAINPRSAYVEAAQGLRAQLAQRLGPDWSSN